MRPVLCSLYGQACGRDVSGAGFSLLELLIALAISAILMAVSVPVYRHHIVLSQRHLAESCLLDLAAKVELAAASHGAYTSSALSSLIKACRHKPGLRDHYQFSFELSGQGQHYQLRARPEREQAVRDSGCGDLLLDDLDVRSASGRQRAAACWGV